MLLDSSSTDGLLEDDAQRTCGGLLLLRKEIALKSHHSNPLSPGLIAQDINHQGAIIC